MPRYALLVHGAATLPGDWPWPVVALEDDATATTLRVRDGAEQLTDGPALEAPAGFTVIDAEDLDAALAWARRVPALAWGGVEVRPVRP